MSDEKPDAHLIRAKLQELKAASWLGARRWWPYFVFHHADVQNIVSILEMGALLSRMERVRRQTAGIDSASPDVIEATDDRWKDFVRFYFRPLTPTFYNIEGFRPKRQQNLKARPMLPIYLLFDSEAVCCRADSRFSNGNLAQMRSSRVAVSEFSTGTDFSTLPFDLIYHNSAFAADQRGEIVCRRHAEVIVPRNMSMDSLKLIWCRTQAEYETLHHLLPPDVWRKWQHLITARTDHNLFNRKWIHVEEVELDNSQIRFRFKPCEMPADRGPFSLQVNVRETATGTGFTWEDADFSFTGPYAEQLTIDLNNLAHADAYQVRLYLDDNLAYANSYAQADESMPF